MVENCKQAGHNVTGLVDSERLSHEDLYFGISATV
jgi:hypothetical protein